MAQRTPQRRSVTRAKKVQKRYAGKNPQKAVRKKQRMRVPQILFVLLLLLLVASVVLFSWNRWLRFDDAQDIQGSWVVQDTLAPVEIDGKKIVLTEDLNYKYFLNTWGKSISYTFDGLKGEAVYIFSPDRDKLVIIEGAKTDWIHAIKVALGLEEPEEGADLAKTTILVRGSDQAILPEGGEGESAPEGETTPEEGVPEGEAIPEGESTPKSEENPEGTSDAAT